MNIAQVKHDFDHQTLIGRATVGDLVDHALALEASNMQMRAALTRIVAEYHACDLTIGAIEDAEEALAVPQ